MSTPLSSYKRLIAQGSMSGFTWAPVYVCYGNNNRTNMLRVPLGGGRVECRAADMSTNLYLGAFRIDTHHPSLHLAPLWRKAGQR